MAHNGNYFLVTVTAIVARSVTVRVTIIFHFYVQLSAIQGGPKKRGHSTFSQISRKLLKISK